MTKTCALGVLFGLSPMLVTAATPVVTYGTYFGGTGDINGANAVAVGPSGEVVMVGSTSSQTLPGTSHAFQPTKAAGFPDSRNAFIAEFDPSGHTLLWATFLGGDVQDIPTAVTVDSAGSVYVIGTTTSSTFPVTSGAYLQSPSAGFAAKIAMDGTSLLYATYLPASPTAFAVNNAGQVYIAGSFGVITPGALGTGVNPMIFGAYLLCLNSAGTGLVFGAYLGGGGFNGSQTTSVAVDPQGNIYVAGFTEDNDILTTTNAFEGQLPNANAQSGFIVEVNSAGSHLLYGTYFSPPYSSTQITSIVAAPDGSVYLAGSINTTASWATPGAFSTTPSPGFVAKLTPGSSVLYAFSYVPIDASFSPLLEIGDQPQTVYVAFATSSGQYGVGVGFKIAELSVPTLALASTFTASSEGFAPLGAVLAPPHSLWLVGSCGSSCGSLISGNAFQATPQSSVGAAVLVQVTDVSAAIAELVNSASYVSGPISPGELVTIAGTAIGPMVPAYLTLDQNGNVSTSLGGVQVLFGGFPAPLTYVSSTQINAIVPYEILGVFFPSVQVEYLGQPLSNSLELTATAVAPAIFTLNASGTGPGAILNQDYSTNSPNNPASKGSYIAVYMTGEGQTSPPGVTGKITALSATPPLTPQPLLPVTALINGQPASVVFYGEAPGIVSGVMQVDIQIPTNAPSGNLPISVSVGVVSSQNGVTVSVQ